MTNSNSYALEASMCEMGEKPAKTVLEDTFFFDRFLGFVEKHDKVYCRYTLSTAERWVAEKNYSAIYHFLRPSPVECISCISYHELASLSTKCLLLFQKKAQEIAPLLDEQQTLYTELMQAYHEEESENVPYWLKRTMQCYATNM